MTAYTFAAQDPNATVNWTDPASWSGRAVPNAPDADVTIPVITQTSTGQAVNFQIKIQNGESIAVNSVTQASDYIYLIGSLTVRNAYLLNGSILLGGGSLSVGSIQIGATNALQGSGTVVSAGAVVNQGEIGIVGSLTADTVQNSGQLDAGTGDFTLKTTHAGGGFSNLVGGVLTGGTYMASGLGTLKLDVGGNITTLAANVTLNNGTIATVDPSSGGAVTLQSTLTTIAAAGSLTLQSAYVTGNALTVQGNVAMSGSGSLSAGALTIAAGGVVSYGGSNANTDLATTNGALVNNGVITAAPVMLDSLTASNTNFYIGSDVAGSGSIVIGPSVLWRFISRLPFSTALATVELGGAASNHVVFSNTAGALVLDAPQSFTGVIDGYVHGDTVSLNGMSLSSITGSSYAGDATGGVLTLNQGATTIHLAFSGNHTIADFSLSAGSQPLSSTPPSVVISDTVTPLTAAQAALSYQAGTIQTPAQVQDTAANVVANLDSLQSIAAAGKLASIALTDSGAPTVTVSVAQFTQDAAALRDIVSAHPLTVAGADTAGATDTAPYSGAMATYTIVSSNGTLTVSHGVAGRIVTDTLTSVEQVQFSDYTLVFDLHSSQDLLVYELYQAAYGRTPDNLGFRYWADVGDRQHPSALALADNFLASREFTLVYGANPSNTTYVTELYAHVLGRAPDQAGLDYWVGQADAGQPRDQLLVDFAVSAENVQLIGAHVSNGYWTVGNHIVPL